MTSEEEVRMAITEAGGRLSNDDLDGVEKALIDALGKTRQLQAQQTQGGETA